MFHRTRGPDRPHAGLPAIGVAMVAGVIGALGAGCGSKRDAAAVAPSSEVRTAGGSGAVAGSSAAGAAKAGSVPDLSRPPVMSADAGLEATWLVASAPPDELARALTPYLGNTIPTEDGALQTWSANGLRMVRVPMADWPALAASLRVSGATQRQWLAQTGEWTEIVRGPEAPRGQIIALDAERLELGPGALRMLSRCWLTPVPPQSPAETGARAELVIELMPQLFESRREIAAPSLKLDARLKPAIDRGMSFDRLAMRLRVRGGEGGDAGEPGETSVGVLLVLAERPGVDWMRASDAEEADDPASEDRPAPGVGEVVRNGNGGKHAPRGAAPVKSDPTGARGAPAGPPTGAGPSAPLLRTLGEAMFSAPLPAIGEAGDETQPPSHAAPRSILVLIPRVPATFRMLPDAPPSAAEARPAAPNKSGRAVGAAR